MQKGTDCVINNVSDATRQWSAVARAVAGTENQDCLLLFVQLDGLIYMNRWLKDASEFENKTSDSCVEDAIIDLLQALTMIEVDSDKLDTSGILMTIKYLLGHDDPKTRNMAKSLLEMWNEEKTNEAVMEGEDNEFLNAMQGSLTPEIQQEIAKDGLLSTASESLKDEEIRKTSPVFAISNQDISYSSITKSFKKPVNANLDKLEPSIACSGEYPSTETCNVVIHKLGVQKDEINGSELDPTRTEKKTQEMNSAPQILDKEQYSKATTNDTKALHPVREPSDIKDNNAGDKDCVDEVSDCLKTAASKTDTKMNDDKSLGYDRNITDFRMKGGDEQNNDLLKVSHTSELKPKDFKGPGGLFERR
ncbi:hypothetical protein LIER_25891 [Lithospermum erythrorhizon]|uniref:TFIIS N-terminal domain-containing protein n=1 Tax=Lithospermum erythrorhizon TaxID=34254 RepID=A0AAV3R6I2_LITER